MRRRIFVPVTFLVLGVLATVGVAWALSWFVQPGGNAVGPVASGFTVRQAGRALATTPIEHGPTHWHVRRAERWGAKDVLVTVVTRPAEPDAPFDELLPPMRPLDKGRLAASATWERPGLHVWDGRGWPMIAMSCEWPWFSRSQWPDVPIRSGITLRAPTDATAWPYGVDQLAALPLHPVWPGFAIDTLFWAALLWLVVRGPGVMRRYWRRRTGRCASCGYRIGTSDVCTECGTTLATRSERSRG